MEEKELSREALATIKSLANRIEDVSANMCPLIMDEAEKSAMLSLIDTFEKQMSGFFSTHLDLRDQATRPTQQEDYKGYFSKKCKYCNSSQTEKRNNSVAKSVYWYCYECRRFEMT